MVWTSPDAARRWRSATSREREVRRWEPQARSSARCEREHRRRARQGPEECAARRRHFRDAFACRRSVGRARARARRRPSDPFVGPIPSPRQAGAQHADRRPPRLSRVKLISTFWRRVQTTARSAHDARRPWDQGRRRAHAYRARPILSVLAHITAHVYAVR